MNIQGLNTRYPVRTSAPLNPYNQGVNGSNKATLNRFGNPPLPDKGEGVLDAHNKGHDPELEKSNNETVASVKNAEKQQQIEDAALYNATDRKSMHPSG